MNLDDIQRELDKQMHEQNNRPIPEFEGYSPNEMHQIIHFTFGRDCPIQLHSMSDSDFQKIPIFNQIKYLLDLIEKSGEMQLTKQGFLPIKVVSELYAQGFLKDELIEKGFVKLYKEMNSMSLNLTRILVELSGLVKKRKGKFSLTKVGAKTIKSKPELLKTIIETFSQKFNWGFYDNYENSNVGQMGLGFSLILLSKYGKERRLDSFYAEKYFKAFPNLINSNVQLSNYGYDSPINCYSIRLFDRFLQYFGIITIEQEGGYFSRSPKYITKTDVFDMLIKVKPSIG